MLDLSKFDVLKNAKWVAADGDGIVYAYADVPRCARSAPWWVADDGKYWKVGKIDAATIDWRQSLTPAGAVDTLLAALLALDGVQECDLIAAFVRADPRRADAFCVTLAEALEPAQSAGAPNETA